MRLGSPPKRCALPCTQATARRTCSASTSKLPPTSCTLAKSGTTKWAPPWTNSSAAKAELFALSRRHSPPCDEDVDRRVGALRRVYVERLDGAGAIGIALWRT